MAKNRVNGSKKPLLDLPVSFGGVSIGKTTGRIGVTVSRNALNINAADESLCGHRLKGRVLLGGSDAANGQGELFDEDEYDGSVSGTFDVKRLSVSRADIGAGLTFSLSDVDVAAMAKFSGGSGRLRIEEVQEIPEDAPDEHAEDKDPVPTIEGPWRSVELSTLFEGALLKSLVEAEINTVGDLSDFTQSGKLLTDLEGIGPGKAAKIEDRMMEFWEANPDARELEEAGA